ncbi:MAG: TetR/AcrR family transcriptional regulator [Hyphomonadaceae bacterium]|nr:TetR/AcrR family transcriptional regulator [Hyphomonadaceae bacterium]
MSDTADRYEVLPGADARAQRTRRLLAEALMNLGADGDVDAIAVGALVNEAGVSRSTFYQHFASKDDFLVRSWLDLLTATERAYAARYPERPDILPSRPLFHHVAGATDFVRSLVRSEVFHRQMAAGEAKLREIAEANLKRRMLHWPRERQREAAVFIAAGFVGMLRWWMEGGLKQSPEKMQAAFERLVQGVLEEA